MDAISCWRWSLTWCAFISSPRAMTLGGSTPSRRAGASPSRRSEAASASPAGAETATSVDETAPPDEQQRCCGARGERCIRPAERETARRRDPHRVAHRGKAAALPGAAWCLQDSAPGAVRKRSRLVGGARSISRLPGRRAAPFSKRNRHERGDRTSAFPRRQSPAADGPARAQWRQRSGPRRSVRDDRNATEGSVSADRCFVLSCNQFTRRSDFPADIPNALAQAPADVVSTGGSCIISPLGEVLAGPARDGEEILFADIDLDEIARGKFDLDVDRPLRAPRRVPVDRR